jgi:AhpD family alkylhydroperoxidase
MHARMSHPVLIFPEALPAMRTLSAMTEKAGVPAKTLGLVHLRASQINGCSVCLDMHQQLAKKEGETDERMFTVAAWRDTPYFDAAERAALELTEVLTRIADRPEGVPDAVWDEASRHYDEKGLAALLLAIATINVWNRLNVATKQIAGAVWSKAS